MNSMTKIIGLVVGVALIAGGGGFWGGMAYQKGQLPKVGAIGNGQFPTGQFPSAGNGSSRSGRPTGMSGLTPSGEITAKDATSLTVKLGSGSTQTVYYSDSTKVLKDATAAADELAVGKKVTVEGTPNSDGSVTATAVRLTE